MVSLALGASMLIAGCGSGLSVKDGKRTVESFIAAVNRGDGKAACRLLSTGYFGAQHDILDIAAVRATRHLPGPTYRDRGIQYSRLVAESRTCPGAIRLVHRYVPRRAIDHLAQELAAPSTRIHGFHGAVTVDSPEGLQRWFVERIRGRTLIIGANAFGDAIENG